MPKNRPEIAVAGHLCLDVTPTFLQQVESLEHLVVPGKLVEVGPMTTSTGGVVSNTGLALHRLGFDVRLMGKVGDDLFGHAILEIIRRHGRRLAESIAVDRRTSSSYTLVINPPGTDRFFLHSPGTNDTFGPEDIPYDQLAGIRLFHFGYPPLMRRMYTQGGMELEAIFRQVKGFGQATSLDMALPDPASVAGRQDWVAILRRVLPFVDVFLPSYDETLCMLKPMLTPQEISAARAAARTGRKGAILARLSDILIEMGAAVVVLKLGDQGLYLRSSRDRQRLAAAGNSIPKDLGAWVGRERLIPCYLVKVVGTTGSGDTTIAGFLGGLVSGLGPEAAMKTAVGAGAFNVEDRTAVVGIPSWEKLLTRIGNNWLQRPHSSPGARWKWSDEATMWIGPADGQ